MLDWALNAGLGFERWTGLWAWIGVVLRTRERMWWRWCQRWQRCSSKNECFSFQGRNESSDEVQPKKHCFYTPHYRLFLHATLPAVFSRHITDCFYTPHYKLILCFYTPPLLTVFACTPHYRLFLRATLQMSSTSVWKIYSLAKP